MSFQNYASAIDQFGAHSFDLVLVDGRSRPSCFKHAVPCVAPNGYIVLDNSDVPHHAARIHEVLVDEIAEEDVGDSLHA